MANRLKVLIYSDCYLYGGSEKIVLNIIKNPIIRENVQPIFAYRKHKLYQHNLLKDYNKEEQSKILFPISILANETLFYNVYLRQIPWIIKKIATIPFIVFSKFGIYFLYNLLSQIVALKKIKPDIVHINNGGYPAAPSCNTMVVASKFCGIRSVIYQVNNIAENQKGFFDKLFDKFINRNVNFFITASSEAKESLSKKRNFDQSKIKKIPNTILEEFVTLSRHQIIESLEFKQTDFILCNVALLSKRKGQRFLLEAMNIIKNNEPNTFQNIRLLIIGNGEEEHRLKDYALSLGILDHVNFLGYKSDAINFINACDVFILPSVASEDMPLVILSAMSKGKTIISTDFAGIKEEIENGESGILISRNTETLSSDLATTIINLFINRNQTYGKNAQKRYGDLFSPVSYGSSLVELYKMSLSF